MDLSFEPVKTLTGYDLKINLHETHRHSDLSPLQDTLTAHKGRSASSITSPYTQASAVKIFNMIQTTAIEGASGKECLASNIAAKRDNPTNLDFAIYSSLIATAVTNLDSDDSSDTWPPESATLVLYSLRLSHTHYKDLFPKIPTNGIIQEPSYETKIWKAATLQFGSNFCKPKQKSKPDSTQQTLTQAWSSSTKPTTMAHPPDAHPKEPDKNSAHLSDSQHATWSSQHDAASGKVSASTQVNVDLSTLGSVAAHYSSQTTSQGHEGFSSHRTSSSLSKDSSSSAKKSDPMSTQNDKNDTTSSSTPSAQKKPPAVTPTSRPRSSSRAGPTDPLMVPNDPFQQMRMNSDGPLLPHFIRLRFTVQIPAMSATAETFQAVKEFPDQDLSDWTLRTAEDLVIARLCQVLTMLNKNDTVYLLPWTYLEATKDTPLPMRSPLQLKNMAFKDFAKYVRYFGTPKYSKSFSVSILFNYSDPDRVVDYRTNGTHTVWLNNNGVIMWPNVLPAHVTNEVQVGWLVYSGNWIDQARLIHHCNAAFRSTNRYHQLPTWGLTPRAFKVTGKRDKNDPYPWTKPNPASPLRVFADYNRAKDVKDLFVLVFAQRTQKQHKPGLYDLLNFSPDEAFSRHGYDPDAPEKGSKAGNVMTIESRHFMVVNNMRYVETNCIIDLDKSYPFPKLMLHRAWDHIQYPHPIVDELNETSHENPVLSELKQKADYSERVNISARSIILSLPRKYPNHFRYWSHEYLEVSRTKRDLIHFVDLHTWDIARSEGRIRCVCLESTLDYATSLIDALPTYIFEFYGADIASKMIRSDAYMDSGRYAFSFDDNNKWTGKWTNTDTIALEDSLDFDISDLTFNDPGISLPKKKTVGFAQLDEVSMSGLTRVVDSRPNPMGDDDSTEDAHNGTPTAQGGESTHPPPDKPNRTGGGTASNDARA
jgi:hypothetical protein